MIITTVGKIKIKKIPKDYKNNHNNNNTNNSINNDVNKSNDKDNNMKKLGQQKQLQKHPRYQKKMITKNR